MKSSEREDEEATQPPPGRGKEKPEFVFVPQSWTGSGVQFPVVPQVGGPGHQQVPFCSPLMGLRWV